jgi:glycosyltransferase involved in cell wall biosynthesis
VGSRHGRAPCATASTISVVIVTHDDREPLLRCLESVFAQAPTRAGVEVIVVDDGSTDATVPSVRALFPSVRIVEKAHTGADNSRNDGIEAARGEIVAFIDSDCTATPHWLASLERALVDEGRPIVGGRIVHPGSLWQRMVGVSDFGEFQGLACKEVTNIPTCNMGVRREWLSGACFDPGLRVGGDVVFCSALRKRGVRLHYDPEVAVSHHPRVDVRHFFARAVSYGAGLVSTRRRDPSLPYSRLVSTGVGGVVVLTLGRTLLDWYRLVRYRRELGIGLAQLPLGAGILSLKRLVSLVGAIRTAVSVRS